MAANYERPRRRIHSSSVASLDASPLAGDHPGAVLAWRKRTLDGPLRWFEDCTL